MPVPNEITFTDMNRIFPAAKCNGKGTKHVIEKGLTQFIPCDCQVCESTKPERKQAYKAFEDRLAAVKEALNENKRRNQSTIG